jgi:hypothetical protein
LLRVVGASGRSTDLNGIVGSSNKVRAWGPGVGSTVGDSAGNSLDNVKVGADTLTQDQGDGSSSSWLPGDGDAPSAGDRGLGSRGDERVVTQTGSSSGGRRGGSGRSSSRRSSGSSLDLSSDDRCERSNGDESGLEETHVY